MTQISAPIFTDAEAFLKDFIPDMCVDGVSVVYRRKLDRETMSGMYFDEEEGKSKFISFQRHVDMLAELVRLISEKKLFVGGIKNPIDLVEPCNWDVEVVDAYFQLLYHGEVIYG